MGPVESRVGPVESIGFERLPRAQRSCDPATAPAFKLFFHDVKVPKEFENMYQKPSIFQPNSKEREFKRI